VNLRKIRDEGIELARDKGPEPIIKALFFNNYQVTMIKAETKPNYFISNVLHNTFNSSNHHS
jgi:hypothetical protein